MQNFSCDNALFFLFTCAKDPDQELLKTNKASFVIKLILGLIVAYPMFQNKYTVYRLYFLHD